MRLGLRARVAFWCAGLVIASGVVVVLLVVVLSGRFLRERNQANDSAVPRTPPNGQPVVVDPTTGRPPPTPQEQARRAASEQAFRDVRKVGFIAVGGLTVVAVGVGWIVAGRIVQPVRAMTHTARSIAATDRLDRRLGLTGPHDELRELGESFDLMLERLQTVFDAQRSFVSNTSHELRTPLAVMQTEVDVALDDPDADPAALRESLQAIGDELQRTTGLVEAMLALSRAESLATREQVDLAQVARAAVDRLPVASASAVRIELDLHEARASGDPVLLGRLAANLVTNAAKYNEPGGLLRVQTRMEGGRATILVENDGPEVEPGAVPTLFSRFTRRAEAGEGHGLGLAIVDAIVTSHRGVLTAKARPEGGLRIEASLPST